MGGFKAYTAYRSTVPSPHPNSRLSQTSMIIFLLLVTLLSRRAGALPMSAGPATTPTIVHNIVFGVFARASCSDMRSMYEIVRSCLFTIAACVYRAIHPNIPDPDLSFWGKLRVTLKITIYALIAPELVIWWALRQRFGARIVVQQINGIIPELKWTQTHGHFAQMGGFGRKDTKHVLHPPVLIQLLEDGQIDIEELQLTEKEIHDKSKGDFLSKALVAFQTTWFVFECLARLHQGLPILELEVVTLAFATLNVITYALWWYKPLHVACPIYLHIHPIPADQPADFASQSQDYPIVDKPEENPLLCGELGAESGLGMVTKGKEMVRNMVSAVKRDLHDEGWVRTTWWWLIVQPFWVVAGPLWDLLSDQGPDNHDVTHVSTFYAMEIAEENFLWVILSSSVIGMIFGAIHLLSWNSTFLTRVQLVLWRASTVVMIVQPCLILLLDLCSMVIVRMRQGGQPYSWQGKVASFVHKICFYVSFWGGTIPYVLARFCVLVLAFVTLRDLPPPAFMNVSWTAYIPHF